MSNQVEKIRVFVSSPSDVKEERDRLRNVVEKLNRIIGPDKNIVLELVDWETHVTPDMGRSQEIINRQIVPYDIFIGIMWKRFGSPTGKAGSGTEEEFNAAYECWKKTGSPKILFYFNQAPYTPRTPEEEDQVRRVREFRAQLREKGLPWKYNGPDEFERFVDEHLHKTILELISGQNMAVTFGDPNLEEAVRSEILKPTGDIPLSSVARLTLLEADRQRIENLDGIEVLTSLRDLNLSHNQIDDISPLSGLISLTGLNISGNRIKDISALSGLISLWELILYNNQISDFSSPSKLTSLKKLWLFGNQINDISELSGLISVTNLEISRNRINDISALSGLISLRELILSNNEISNISELSGCASLTLLHLDSNQIKDLSPLLGLTQLKELYVKNNLLSDVAINEQIPALEAQGVNVR